jgi:hypothetical protein
MSTPSDAPSVSPPPAPEPLAEPPVAAEGAQLSLKVRTLDQKTYPITICAAASVPQLKELVAVETGVTLPRQRLIYRGRVLKNDQTLASYSLEDGHVLHLVVRATPPDAAAAAAATPGQTPATGTALSPDAASRATTARRAHVPLRSRQRRSARSTQPPRPRDNDEPDPSMGRAGAAMPSRVLMGATISVPEGADVTMPFLSSMIANLVTQVSEGGVGVETGEGATAADGRRHVTFSGDVLGGAGADGSSVADRLAAARAQRHHHRNRDATGSGRQRHARRSSSSAERQAALRARNGLRLESVRATLNDAALDFPADLAPLQEGDGNAGMVELQQQVDLFVTLTERFGPRLRLLPAALAARDRLGERPTSGAAPAGSAAGPAPASSARTTAAAGSTTAPAESTSAPSEAASSTEHSSGNTTAADTTVSARQLIRAIEALQTFGESTDLLARMARHAFVRQSMQLGEPITRRVTGAGTANTAAGDRIQATLDAIQAASQSARPGGRGAANIRPRFRVARFSATDLLGEGSSAAPAATTRPNAMPGLTPSFPVDLTGSSAGALPSLSGSATSTHSNQPGAHTGRADAVPDDANGSMPPVGARISIAGIGGLPLMSSVVFPFSLAAGLGGSHATTTWNLADFVSRLTSELPISTLYGVMAGDATELHHVLAHVGFALFSGVDVPRVSRPSIRTWAQDLVDELRRLLRSHALPAAVLQQVAGSVERQSALGNELLRVVEPFVPDIVDFLVRATSASRAAAFGVSSATFLRRMMQQVVRQLRAYARGESTESEDESDARLKRLLRGFLVWLGMNEHMASFVVDSLLCWTAGDNSRRGRTRQREAVDGATDSPATKRRRE